MKNIKITCKNAPKAIGPYSHAVEASGKLLFVSGQLPVDPKTNKFVARGIVEQTQQALMNAKAILKTAGYELTDICKTTVFLSDIQNFTAMNQVYAEILGEVNPARSAFEVANLPLGALVEIELIASK
ncbi:TdcF protein [Spiroplasma clarkii]|uniref:2-iminobutanoate/2-iminopropanoate deaminase n=1 Tax=Spiroplasma clarkii TaxID=2139 RepID=A0A1Y0L0H0_9MOLU|nr:Rid family detoxifying hydrolase [Spiroplasma clarkii]ARU91497.1 TdcF protein [Spiroplasma clarkii]ATX70912.1 2-iminobutanoate/2-iminopropanoate deaminase [Spiroplasma clarkii]